MLSESTSHSKASNKGIAGQGRTQANQIADKSQKPSKTWTNHYSKYSNMVQLNTAQFTLNKLYKVNLNFYANNKAVTVKFWIHKNEKKRFKLKLTNNVFLISYIKALKMQHYTVQYAILTITTAKVNQNFQSSPN